MAHKREFNELPQSVVAVPQPTTIIGAFSETVKGWSLLCNTPDGIVISLSKRDDNVVRVVSAEKQDRKRFTLSSIKYRAEDRWAGAVKAVFWELEKLKIKTTGFNILISGNGSSSFSFSLLSQIYVGLSIALSRLLNLNYDSDDIFYLALRSSSFMPQSVRYRDLWILVYGEEKKIYLYDGKERTFNGVDVDFSPYKAYLLNTGLPSSVLAPEWDEFRAAIPALVDKYTKKFGRVKDFRALTEREIRFNTVSFPDRERRALLFLNCASSNAKNAFLELSRKDYPAFGKLLSSSQSSLMTNAELTSPELDWIFRRSKEAQSVLGLGTVDVSGAGSFLILIDEKHEDENNQRVEEYERIFGFHTKSGAFSPCHAAGIVEFE